MKKIFSIFLLFIVINNVQAFELSTEKVTDNIYALVGEIGPRSYENHALNNTMGFIVTDKGVVLVSSGASPAGAALIEKAIEKVTPKPINWVVNIGTQDHHWLGNSYFAEKGAEIIALERTVKSQKENLENHMNRLRQVTKEQADKVKPVYASKQIKADKQTLQFGDVEAELSWLGGGHFPNDAVLWLPKQKVVFAGDIIFNDRMLGVQPESDVITWGKAFDAIAMLKPEYVIPGHGHPSDLAKAKRDTGDYLHYLITNIQTALEDWKEIDDTINDMADAPAFKHLQFYDGWHKRNINRTYLQFEANQ